MTQNNIACGCAIHQGTARRQFLRGAAALGAAAALPGCTSMAIGSKGPVIDVHHHYYPPELLAAVRQATGSAGPPSVLKWTPAVTVEELDRNGVNKAMLSLWSIPGGWMGSKPDGMQRFSRLSSDYGAKMVRDFPGRFGLFASLPLPDVDLALKEIDYVYGTLKADGIGLPTNWGTQWPGDPKFNPVWEELNRRKAIVYFHPVALNCCGDNFVPGVDASWMEVPYDTGRAVLSMLMSGTLARYQDITWIFSHSGGTVPILAERVKALGGNIPRMKQAAPRGIDYELKRLYYETANGAWRPNLAALLGYVPVSQVMFGTDYPYVTVGANLEGLRAYGLSGADLNAIQYENAARVIPAMRL